MNTHTEQAAERLIERYDLRIKAISLVNYAYKHGYGLERAALALAALKRPLVRGIVSIPRRGQHTPSGSAYPSWAQE